MIPHILEGQQREARQNGVDSEKKTAERGGHVQVEELESEWYEVAHVV